MKKRVCAGDKVSWAVFTREFRRNMNCKPINKCFSCSFVIGGRLNPNFVTFVRRQRFSTNAKVGQSCTKNEPRQFAKLNKSTFFERTFLFDERASFIKRDSFLSKNLCMISNAERICWNCKKKIGKEIFFCKLCKIIQPPLNELSLFEIFER